MKRPLRGAGRGRACFFKKKHPCKCGRSLHGQKVAQSSTWSLPLQEYAAELQGVLRDGTTEGPTLRASAPQLLTQQTQPTPQKQGSCRAVESLAGALLKLPDKNTKESRISCTSDQSRFLLPCNSSLFWFMHKHLKLKNACLVRHWKDEELASKAQYWNCYQLAQRRCQRLKLEIQDLAHLGFIITLSAFLENLANFK